jgi:hypothetical protein
MTYRGVYRNGVVVIDGEVGWPDGASVEVRPAARRAKRGSNQRARPTSKAKRKPSEKKVDPIMALAGIWKDRPDWRGLSTLQVVAKLRERASGGATVQKRRG